MGNESPSNKELLLNCIGFFVPSCIFFMGRLLNGAYILKRLQIDDYMMMVFFFIYSSLLVLINVSAHFATNLFPPEELAAIMADPVDVQDRILGSKIVIPLEQCMLVSTWGVKACLLMFLYRMTHQMPMTRLALWFLTAFTVIGFCVIEICYYGFLCQPFSEYWAMPVTNSECATYANYSRIQMSFNISSDLGIILLPVSILWRSGLPPKRKILLTILFSMGVFTIICAILNKYYNFASPETTTYMLWYIREASVAMWVGNIICCWQLIQFIFKLRSFDDKSAGMGNVDHLSSGLHTIGGHSKNAAWYRRMMALAPNSFAIQTEKTIHDDNTTSTLVEDNPKFDPLHTETRTVFDLERDGDDARPALAYRRSQNIQ